MISQLWLSFMPLTSLIAFSITFVIDLGSRNSFRLLGKRKSDWLPQRSKGNT
jgi:hypothetical protein